MPIYKRLEGQKFGKITVLRRLDSKNNRARWLCECECGNRSIHYTFELTSGQKTQCYSCAKKIKGQQMIKDITGMRFGKLTALRYISLVDDYTTQLNGIWEFKCDCGNIIRKEYKDVKHNSNVNCGCVKSHKDSRSNERLYTIYLGMHYRCENKNNQAYELYGDRGIKVCDEWSGWNGYDNFKKWSLENGYADNLSIDRIDNNGNYEPSNCRWADSIQQNNNTRRNRRITYNGKTQTITEWARETGLTVATIKGRLKYSNDIERILSTPIDTKYHHGETEGTFVLEGE